MKIDHKKIAIVEGATLELGAGYTAVVHCEPDTDAVPPWDWGDGHGSVSEWTTRAKEPGERVLAEDGRSKRYYDFAGAVKLARRDGWGSQGDEGLSKGAKAAKAAEADYEFLRAWCADEWHYIGVVVEVWYRGEQINERYHDALWGVEDCGDYWQEVAADLISDVIRQHRTERNQAAARKRIETRERRYWAARGVVTK